MEGVEYSWKTGNKKGCVLNDGQSSNDLSLNDQY